MTYAAKLVYNIHNWVTPSGHVNDGVGIHVNIGQNGYNFGMEEWLNKPLLCERNLGYLDCYRFAQRPFQIDRICLFTFYHLTHTVYYVGNVYGVTQITPQLIPLVREELLQAGWFGEINHDFEKLGDHRPILQHTEYQTLWNSNEIVANTGEGFLVNISYEKLEIFERGQWRNLTAIDFQFNTSWRHLAQLYTIPTQWIRYF